MLKKFQPDFQRIKKKRPIPKIWFTHINTMKTFITTIWRMRSFYCYAVQKLFYQLLGWESTTFSKLISQYIIKLIIKIINKQKAFKNSFTY